VRSETDSDDPPPLESEDDEPPALESDSDEEEHGRTTQSGSVT